METLPRIPRRAEVAAVIEASFLPPTKKVLHDCVILLDTRVFRSYIRNTMIKVLDARGNHVATLTADQFPLKMNVPETVRGDRTYSINLHFSDETIVGTEQRRIKSSTMTA